MTREEVRKEIDKITEPTAENAIEDMKMSKKLHITKDGKFYGIVADNYTKKLHEYSSYCKEETEEEWNESIEKLIGMSGEVHDIELLELLYSIEYCGVIMKSIHDGSSWDEIRKLYKNQGHFNVSISLLGQNMLHFSKHGVEFVEEVIGIKKIETLRNLNKVYQTQKKLEEGKQSLTLNRG